jgi:hypothetical protein
MNARLEDRSANRRNACCFCDLEGLVQFPMGSRRSAPPIMSSLTRSTCSIRTAIDVPGVDWKSDPPVMMAGPRPPLQI